MQQLYQDNCIYPIDNPTVQGLLISMASKGIPFTGSEFSLDGTFHRYSADSKKEKDEYYKGIVLQSGLIIVHYGTWSGEHRSYKWNSRSLIDTDVAEVAEYEEAQELHQQQLKAQYAEAIVRAGETWDATAPADENFPYLVKKQILPQTIRSLDGRIVIPIYNERFELISLQFIDTQGAKRFLYGSSPKNGFHPIGLAAGDKPHTILVAEGYATAMTLATLLKQPVVAAMSASNQSNVGGILKLKFPNARLIFCGEIGKASDQAAVEWRMVLKNDNCVVPKFPHPESTGTDFNDLYMEEGVDSVRLAFRSLLLFPPNLDEYFELNPAPVEPLWGRIFIKKSINAIYGATGRGKSFIASELGLSLACGHECFGLPCVKSRVLVLDIENSDGIIQERLLQIIQRKQLAGQEICPENIHFLTIDNIADYGFSGFNLIDPDQFAAFSGLFLQYDVVILDNLIGLCDSSQLASRDHLGQVQEAWHKLKASLDPLMRKGVCFIIVHHANRGGDIAGDYQIYRDVNVMVKLQERDAKGQIKDLDVRLGPDDGYIGCGMIVDKGRHLKGKEKQARIITYRPNLQGVFEWGCEWVR